MAGSEQDRHYMRQALTLARRGCGWVSPNPMVGAVLVRDGRVVGRGWHQRFGEAHAEVHALADAGAAARGATMYVNLEPCSHQGKTPPCADALVAAGVGRVVVGMQDPNPAVRGQGMAKLRAAGIALTSGVLEQECRLLNEAFITFISTGMPFVTLKAAMTLDGRIATHTGDSKWITGTAARSLVHRMRAEHDGVMVGAGTVLADDAQLTVRMYDGGGRPPLRIVVDEALCIPMSSRVLQQQDRCPTLVVTAADRVASKAGRALSAAGVAVLGIARQGDGLDLRQMMRELAGRKVASILLEGGSTLNASVLAARLVRKIAFFYAPRILGGDDAQGVVGGRSPQRIAEALPVSGMRVEQIGDDLLVCGYLPEE